MLHSGPWIGPFGGLQHTMHTAASTENNQLDRPALLGVPRGVRIVSKTIYKELRAGGLSEDEVLAIATELLGLVAAEIRANAV